MITELFDIDRTSVSFVVVVLTCSASCCTVIAQSAVTVLLGGKVSYR